MDGTPSSPVRVLWLTKGLGPGGAERLLVSFAALADHERFDLRAAYLLPWKNHLVGELGRHGVPATCLQGPREVDPRWTWRLRDLVRTEQIDIVHSHSPVVAALARPVLRTLGRHRPVLIGTEHNVWSSHRPATRWANRLTLPLQQATIAVSDQVRASMPSRVANRTEVLVHGVDVDAITARRGERDAARHQLGVRDDDLLVVTVANLRSNKDYPTMLAAARRLVDRGLPFRFLSVGQGPLEHELAAERDRLGLGDRFTFLGYRDDPLRVLVAGDVFCLSSRFEGLPIAVLEALAAGLPVVATTVGAVPTVVREGREGRLVPPGDPVALADAIASMENRDVRARHAANAACRAHDFGIAGAVARQQELYATLAASR